ncbi:MAG: EF-P lysine aminoacylase GenX [Pseudolabrys sp.]|nr:EF-P lysine aminoacylase GenX [Pseudolabrys sp.]
MTKEASSDWRTQSHAARRPYLQARGLIVTALRGWFAAQDFIEVETPIVQVSPGNETHLHAFGTSLIGPGGEAMPLYLRTSPEFACKKLLAAGESRIVEFARSFRNRERGRLHHPEFTLIEWYRANETYEVLMKDCTALLAEAARAAGATRLAHRDRSADPFAAPLRLTVAEAFSRYAGIDVLATVRDGEGDPQALARAARQAGVTTADDDDWTDVFSRILADKVEPRLAEQSRAVLLCDYPAPVAALARLKVDDPRVSERFELYACGVELANGFGELTDAREQRRRFEQAMAEKYRRYGERYPLDDDFLAALGQMPPACGVALGLDRLVMLATGAARIEDVLWSPVAEPAAPLN